MFNAKEIEMFAKSNIYPLHRYSINEIARAISETCEIYSVTRRKKAFLDDVILSVKTILYGGRFGDSERKLNSLFVRRVRSILSSRYETISCSDLLWKNKESRLVELFPDIAFNSASIDGIGLSARTRNALRRNDIHYACDLSSLRQNDLYRLRGVGKRGVYEVIKSLLADGQKGR